MERTDRACDEGKQEVLAQVIRVGCFHLLKGQLITICF